MWREPYLETCCRSALHRLILSAQAGRPTSLSDGPCLKRLGSLGLARQKPDLRYEATADGILRHRSEILRLP